MKLIQWNDKFSTGRASVDHDHRELIAMINKALTEIHGARDADRIGFLLGEIQHLIASHFAHEEKLMKEARYDGFAEHKEDHERLLDEIREITEAFEGTEGGAVEALLAGRLNEWFSRHFQTLDAKLHKVLG